MCGGIFRLQQREIYGQNLKGFMIASKEFTTHKLMLRFRYLMVMFETTPAG